MVTEVSADSKELKINKCHNVSGEVATQHYASYAQKLTNLDKHILMNF
jgi:hypothetical protein